MSTAPTPPDRQRGIAPVAAETLASICAAQAPMWLAACTAPGLHWTRAPDRFDRSSHTIDGCSAPFSTSQTMQLHAPPWTLRIEAQAAYWNEHTCANSSCTLSLSHEDSPEPWLLRIDASGAGPEVQTLRWTVSAPLTEAQALAVVEAVAAAAAG